MKNLLFICCLILGIFSVETSFAAQKKTYCYAMRSSQIPACFRIGRKVCCGNQSYPPTTWLAAFEGLDTTL